jgi:signal transduction histidine kinase
VNFAKILTLSFSLAVIVLPFSNAKAEECSKKAVEAKVNEVCGAISKKGAAVKADWPGGLLFKNCGDNYVWVQDTDPNVTMVTHPIKFKLDGESLLKHTDENKLLLFVEFDKQAKAKPAGAWVDYLWKKPGVEVATAKTSFVKTCKHPDGKVWIAGSGIWKEDVK